MKYEAFHISYKNTGCPPTHPTPSHPLTSPIPRPKPPPLNPALTLARSRGPGHYGGFPGATATAPPCHRPGIVCIISGCAPSNIKSTCTSSSRDIFTKLHTDPKSWWCIWISCLSTPPIPWMALQNPTTTIPFCPVLTLCVLCICMKLCANCANFSPLSPNSSNIQVWLGHANLCQHGPWPSWTSHLLVLLRQVLYSSSFTSFHLTLHPFSGRLGILWSGRELFLTCPSQTPTGCERYVHSSCVKYIPWPTNFCNFVTGL